MDAAHRDEFSHTTQRMRQQAATKVLVNPARAVANKPKLHVDPTNVRVLLLQQEVVFANWWAQMIPKKACGRRAMVPLCVWRRRRSRALGSQEFPRGDCSLHRAGICLLSSCVAWGHASRKLLNPTWCAQLRKARSSRRQRTFSSRTTGGMASWRPFGPHCPRASLLNTTVGNFWRVALKGGGSGPYSD